MDLLSPYNPSRSLRCFMLTKRLHLYISLKKKCLKRVHYGLEWYLMKNTTTIKQYNDNSECMCVCVYN